MPAACGRCPAGGERTSSEVLSTSSLQGPGAWSGPRAASVPRVGEALLRRDAPRDLGSRGVDRRSKAETARESPGPATGLGLSERGFCLSARSSTRGQQAPGAVTTDRQMTNGSLGFLGGASEQPGGPGKGLLAVSAPTRKMTSGNGTLLRPPAAAADGGGGRTLRAAARLEGTPGPQGLG